MELYTMEGFKINTLEHHGIKGQRWGIRRYQNRDGSLTPEGKSRYSAALNKAKKEYEQTLKELKSYNYYEKERKQVGIKRVNETTDIIPKGVEVKSFLKSDKLENRRLYTSVLPSDTKVYSNIEHTNGVGLMTLKTTKQIKVATPEVVDEYVQSYIAGKKVEDVEQLAYPDEIAKRGEKRAYKILEKYGDVPLSDLAEMFAYKDDLRTYTNDRKIRKIIDEVSDVSTMALTPILDMPLVEESKTYQEMYKHFKDLGYDAVVYYNDKFVNNLTEYPVVFLNPTECLEQVNYESRKKK